MNAHDAGWQARFNILRADATESILNLLRLHNWTAEIVDEVRSDQFLIVAAERSGLKRAIALLFSASTDNQHYRSLERRADIILYRGANCGDYHKQWSHGVTKPIMSSDEFPAVLVEWNRESLTGEPNKALTQVEEESSVEEGSEEGEAEANRPKFLRLLSDTPIEAIWIRLAQLRSTTLAKKLVVQRAKERQYELSAEACAAKGEGVSFSLRNAFDYFNKDQSQNVSQRILSLYYGALSFAFAEMLSTPDGPADLAKLEETTTQGHGLFTYGTSEDGFEGMALGGLTNGFFAYWSKHLKCEGLVLSEKRPKKPSDIEGIRRASWVRMDQLFGRIPELSDLFLDIFDGPPSWIIAARDNEANGPNRLNFVPSVPKPTATYIRLSDFSGRLSQADMKNFQVSLRELTTLAAIAGEQGKSFRGAYDHVETADKFNVYSHLQTHSSAFFRSPALIMPLFGGVKQYRAICIVMLYALSILVRYRPSVWRRVLEGDLDHYRALVEAFLTVVERVLPEQFLATITGQAISAQPAGSFLS